MKRAVVAALLLAAATTGSLARAQSLDGLLRDVTGAGASEARIRVDARLEGEADRLEVVVALAPEGGARLVADPGIQVVPLPGSAGPWAAVGLVEEVGRQGSYFDGPVELRVPVAAGASGEASAEVAYAWCVVERICLFGQALVTVPLSAAGG